MDTLNILLSKIALLILRGYQYFISPWVGQHCRFYPTCSEYAKSAINQYGIICGGWLVVRRLCRCHPFHAGGCDPVPPTLSSKDL